MTMIALNNGDNYDDEFDPNECASFLLAVCTENVLPFCLAKNVKFITVAAPFKFCIDESFFQLLFGITWLCQCSLFNDIHSYLIYISVWQAHVVADTFFYFVRFLPNRRTNKENQTILLKIGSYTKWNVSIGVILQISYDSFGHCHSVATATDATTVRSLYRKLIENKKKKNCKNNNHPNNRRGNKKITHTHTSAKNV